MYVYIYTRTYINHLSLNIFMYVRARARAYRITYAHRRQISRALVKAGKTCERFCSHNRGSVLLP